MPIMNSNHTAVFKTQPSNVISTTIEEGNKKRKQKIIRRLNGLHTGIGLRSRSRTLRIISIVTGERGKECSNVTATQDDKLAITESI